MMRAMVMLAGLLVSNLVMAFEAQTGQWWNPNESGSGYNIDIQNGILVVTIFSYKANGDSEWYISSGALTNGGHTYTGTLDKYRNGQCISCAYVGRPSSPGNDGALSITFTSETSATMTLPNGRTTAIVPFDFGYGGPPNGLLGEWVYFYDILTTFAERFNFTTRGDATSSGNGTAIDLANNAICEYKTSGTFVGQVLCFDFDSTLTKVQNQYQYRWGVNEGYGGIYTFPASGNTYPMKAVRTKDNKGGSRATGDDSMAIVKATQDAREPRSAVTRLDAATAVEADELRAVLVRAKAAAESYAHR